MLGALYAYRHFIVATIQSEFRARFIRSSFGALWYILNPLAQAAIYAFVLSNVLSARLPGATSQSAYAVYLLAGSAAWALFSEILLRCVNIFIEFGAAMKKIAFPRSALPVIVLGGALTNHGFLLLAILAIVIVTGNGIGVSVLAIPIATLLLALMAISLGLILGIFNVFARDVSQVMGVVMQLWFWMTPVVYPVSALPNDYRWLIEANPLTRLVAIYQNALLQQPLPEPAALFWPTLTVLVVGLAAKALFDRASSEIVDAI